MSARLEFSVQAPSAVVMVRPHHFSVNTETAAATLRIQCLRTTGFQPTLAVAWRSIR